MKVTYRDLLDRLGVARALKPYDTETWQYMDEEKGITADAAVRIDSTIQTLQAELQFIYDKPQPDKPMPVEIVCYLELEEIPGVAGKYTAKKFTLQGKLFNKLYDWESKSCNFFRACVREIKAGRLPDIELLINRELGSREVWGGGGGGGSEKSPRINTQQLLYDYKNPGRGF